MQISIQSKIFLCTLIVATIFLGISFLSISENENIKYENQIGKLMPNEWQFTQRAYPTGSIDMHKYFKALTYRKEKTIQNKSLKNAGWQTESWQFSGPTNIGGRITDVEMTSGTKPMIYVGAASGGIFRSEDEGLSWEAIFDNELSLSIGDMAIAPSNEKIIFAGTGEANAGGGSLAYDGNGLYKSSNGGDSWKHIGLDSIGSVGKVLVNPKDTNTCYVGAMGYLFRNNSKRGVFKTTDGGISWQQILYLNDSTGIIDMAIHPLNPDIIYAAAWERVRRVNRRSYGGASSGIYKTMDGGKTWQKLLNGLPASAGRIGLSISPSDPNILYAMFTDENSGYIKGIYKSTNNGNNWASLNTGGISDVPYMWWFGKITVDINDPNLVYFVGFDMHKSENGGTSWYTIFPGAHVDQHALCVNPQNSNMVIAGNDGGIYISQDGGENYSKSNNLPITQFYTCEIDYSRPERLYGGTQDNSTMRTLTGNIDDWEIIYFGDGFQTLVDPSNNNFVYTEYQYGNFAKSTNGGLSFFNATSGISGADRKNWNTPVIFSPNDPTILYYGSNRLYKSPNRAIAWSAISPDLTKNLSQNNLVFGTITSISVSAIDEDVIYVGTDDGNVQITLNGGSSWSLVSAALPNRWVTSVLADPSDVNTAYVSYSGYRFGQNEGHIYKTTNSGMSWMDISGDLAEIPINKLIIDPLTQTLIIATDIGVYYSINQGINWELLGEDLPNLIITDICYHPVENILVAATYGRGLYKISLGVNTSLNYLNNEGVTNLKSYPNPSFDETVFEFKINNRRYCKINLLSVSGNNIKYIYDGFLNEGIHKFKVDVSKLSPGIYICQLSLNNNLSRSSLKLVIL